MPKAAIFILAGTARSADSLVSITVGTIRMAIAQPPASALKEPVVTTTMA